MAAFRKVFLALAVVAAVSSTAPSVFAQVAVSCTAGTVLPVVRVEGITEYVGDIFVTCTGGNPTAAGVVVGTDNFELDINDTTFTSRLLDASLPSVNGGYPYVESVIIIDEAFPTGSQNPTTVPQPIVPPSEWSITQSGCPQSDQTGKCPNYGNGLGGWGTDGSDDTSSYGTGNTAHGRPYNVYQGYQFSNHALRFDDIPVDPPGVGLITICYDDDSVCQSVTPEISFRITNVRVDVTPFAPATPLSGFGPGIYGTLTVTGSQPVTFSNISSNPVTNTNIELAVPEHTLHQVTVTEDNSLICQDCSFYRDDESSGTVGAVVPGVDAGLYYHQTFNYYAQENFASAFEAQTWYYDDSGHYTKHDPHTRTGHGAGNHTPASPYTLYSTQDIAGFPYFTASNFYPDGDTDLPQSSSGYGLIDPEETGQATNGLRVIFSLANITPGVTVTAPGVGCIYGGTAPTGQHNMDHYPCTPAPSNPIVGGLAASGIAILLGAVTPNGSVDTDYGGPTSFYGFSPIDVTITVASASEPIQFVYEIMYADGGFIETMWIPFDVNWCSLTIAPLPPPIATAQVGIGPVSNGANNKGVYNNMPSQAVEGEGDFEFPRFVWGSAGNPLAPQNVWYLDNCNCDLLFPYVAADAGFDTGFAISNTSADPYGTNRSDGYVQFFYYLNSLLAPTFVTPKDAYGRNLLGNDGVLAAGPASNVGPGGGTYTVYTDGVYDPANGINARSSFQQITFNPVAAGDQFIALLSTGAWVNGQKDLGWAGTPGFEGYIFAISGFPYCHGFAFISNGTTYQTQGYLGLVIDEGRKLRRANTWDFETTSGVLTTDPSWSYSSTGVVTPGTNTPIIYVLNPRDTNRDDYNN